MLLFKLDDNLRWKKKKMMERKGKRRRRKKCCDESSLAVGCEIGSSPKRASNGEKMWLLKVLLLFASTLPVLLLSAVAEQEIGEGLTLTNPAGDSSRQQQQRQQEQANELLTVQQLERIKSESKVSASVGQNVILNCAVQFKDGIEKPFVVNWLKYPHKLPIYIWYAGYPPHVAQGYEARVSRIGQASLNLTRVRESDQGLYECKIYYLDRRPEDKGNGTWIFLDVQAPPRFLQTPATTSYVQAGDSLHLTCQAESTPAPTLRWYKNKTPIDTDSGAFRLSSSGHDLPSAGTALDLGHSTAKSDAHSRDSDLMSSPSNRHLLGAPSSAQLDLFIDNVQAGSTTGEYRCLASNSEGSVEARSQVVLAVPAIITDLPKNQTRVEGERLEFPCQAKALPANITYKWLFNDKLMQQLKWFDGRFTVRRDGTLVIHALHRDDQGQYKCQATNGLSHRQRLFSTTTSTTTTGSGQKHAPGDSANKTTSAGELAPIYAEAGAYLTVEYAARVAYSPTLQYLPLGLSGVIRCHWEASPPVLYYDWSLNGKQFDPDLDNNMERLKNGSLLVRQVSKQYEGKYMCTPFNKHGTLGSSAAMEVRVAEPPEFELKPAEFYKANLNGHIKIPCSARAYPRANVGWRRVVAPKPPQQHHHHHVTGAPGHSGVTAAAAGESEEEPQVVAPVGGAPSARTGGDVRAESGAEEEQQSVIVYAKLPSDRSEYKNSHLLLHTLHKEDHGRYECFIENEAATLVASTMLYIEDTSPHAPTNIQVETKSWSARVSWQPGYDGGFEQAFVVWYRQVPHSSGESSPGNQQATASGQHEPVDLSWRSMNVHPSDATSFTVQNLTQDTNYEFYVRAKNIVGESPRSQVVSAQTKRALTGSLAPVHPDQAPGLTPASPRDGELDPSLIRHNMGGDDEEHDDVGPTINPNVMGIIHLVYTTESPTPGGEQTELAAGSDNQSSASQQQQQTNESVHQPTSVNSGNTQTIIEDQQKDSTSSTNSSKVIRIYFPANNKQANSPPDTHSTSTGNKRPRFDQPDNNKSSSGNQSAPQAPAEVVDTSTAPQNVSLTKVAQGWVINWWPPARPPGVAGELGEMAAASQSTPLGVTLDQPPQQQQQQQQQANAYWVEFREKNGGWQSLTASRETKILLKDLKPGSEYQFRVFAVGPDGTRGSPSPELKHLIPDNRRKPGGTQALSAGVVSGVLFFIACIVIAVCAVNMCNKRRKKRAEKAAYVMMACPVLESHHDIAALNTNSLMKNGSANTSQGRVPGVNQQQQDQASSLALVANQLINRLLGNVKASEGAPHANERSQPLVEADRHIRYSSNAPVPVDVAAETSGGAEVHDEIDGETNIPMAPTPIDDYWIRKPSDRKWGTLTLAGSRLAEKRARQAQEDTRSPVADVGRSVDVDSLAGGYYSAKSMTQQPAISGTLPRYFKQALPGVAGQHRDPRSWQLAQMSEQSHRQFNDWLRSQLSGGAADTSGQPAAAGMHPSRPIAPPRPPPRTGYPRQDSSGGSANNTQPSAYHFSRSITDPAGARPVARYPQPALHQRSISQIEPASLTNYWLLQQQQQAAAQRYAASLNGQLYASQQGATPVMFYDLQPSFNPSQTTATCVHQPPANSYLQQQEVTDSVHQQQQLGKRNSLQRSTLPLTAAASTHFWSPMQQTQEPMLCPFYPLLGPPPPPPPSQSQNLNQQYPNGMGEGYDDDPVTANACLGSYKRKRRLPHIEAQFTITPPTLPPKELATDVPDDAQVAERRERDAVANGHLFVRSLPNQQQQQQQQRQIESVAPTTPCDTKRKPPPPPPLPGLPPPGQRREQQRLKPSRFEPLAQVEPIGVSEKIENYLRYQAEAVAGSGCEFRQEDSNDDLPEKSTPVELEQVRELIFQPYHNLPQLKYSISLPLERGHDGTLRLAETSHLRRSRRGNNRRRSLGARTADMETHGDMQVASVTSTDESLQTSTKPATRSVAANHKQRLGSSSSCPAPVVPAQFADLRPSACAEGTSSFSLDDRVSQSVMLNDTSSAFHQPLLPHHLRPIAADSLEEVMTSVKQLPLSHASQSDAASKPSETDEPYYLQSSNEETDSLQPPPVPPHKTKPTSSKHTLADAAASNESSLSSATASVPDEKRNPPPVVGTMDSGREPSSSDSSQSPLSSSSSSSSTSSSGSAATTTENGGATSEALTNEHSVDMSTDEQYEFDLEHKRSAPRNVHQLMNGVVYTRVNKHQRSRDDDTNKHDETPRPRERSRLYCDFRRMEVPLSMKEPPPPPQLAQPEIREPNAPGERRGVVSDSRHSDIYDEVTS